MFLWRSHTLPSTGADVAIHGHAACTPAPNRGSKVQPSLKTTVLRRAAALLGGAARLREVLGVTEEVYASWISGAQEPPEPAFLRALSVILDDLDERYGA